MVTAAGLAAYARQQVGKAYLYGSFGQSVTDGFIAQKKTQYPAMYTAEYCAKAKRLIGKTAFDCVGLIKACYWNGTYDAKTDLSADGMYRAATKKGGLANLPEQPGVLVWRSGHIGVYVGGGEVVEARGIDYGVVRTKLTDRNFTNWCQCPYIDYPAVAGAASTAVKTPKQKLLDLGVIVPGDGLDHPAQPLSQGVFLEVMARALTKL